MFNPIHRPVFRRGTLGVLAAAGLALTTASAGAEVVRFNLDESETFTSFEICITIFGLGFPSCSESLPTTSGWIDLDIDNPSAPTTVSVVDYEFNYTPLMFEWDLDIGGTLAATVDNNPGVDLPDGEGPVGPLTLAPDGSFAIAALPSVSRGSGTLTGDTLAGEISEPFDLSAGEPADIPILNAKLEVMSGSGSDTLVLTMTMTQTESQSDSGILISSESTIDVYAAAVVDAPGCNEADLVAPFGILNFADVQSFLGQFNTQGAPADLAAPAGVFNFADVQAFIGAFTTGCES